jgi:hypothetical protein
MSLKTCAYGIHALTTRDSRLPSRFKWDLRSSGMLFSVHWQLFTDVSGQPFSPIHKSTSISSFRKVLPVCKCPVIHCQHSTTKAAPCTAFQRRPLHSSAFTTAVWRQSILRRPLLSSRHLFWYGNLISAPTFRRQTATWILQLHA